jgi:2,5-furandicarboxylate decarboxylase 1
MPLLHLEEKEGGSEVMAVEFSKTGQDLRSTMNILEKSGDLVHIRVEVDPRFEVSAALLYRPKGVALCLDRVRGYTIPIVGNLLNTRKKYGLSLGISESQTFLHTVHGLNHPIKPRMSSEGPCQEVLICERIDLLKILPIPTFCEKDRNPYITAGVLIAKDPETGSRNVSINRLQVKGPDQLMVGMAPSHHLYQLLKKAETRGKKLPIAIAIGNHPAIMVAACMYVELGFDELEIAGGLLGTPIDIVRGKTVEVEIPAHAEIIIEGEIDAAKLEEEGPFGEYSGFYESYGKSPMMSVTAVTHRENPIFQVIVPSKHPEHLLTGGLAIEATVFRAVKKLIPNLKEVVITEGGCGRLHAVLCISQPKPGEAKKAMMAVFANLNLAKSVIVVNDDIDPRDPAQVEWAIATRMRADRDIVVITDVMTDRSEPLEKAMTVAKMGIDATKPYDLPSEMFEIADAPEDVKERIAQKLEGLGL